MGLSLRMGIGMGAGGGAVSYTNPALPQAANIVRAWSLRRCVPAYKKGNSIRADRPSAPVGAPGLLGVLNKAGVIDFPAGADANAYELYDQMGEANAALVVAGGNLANAPLVYSSGAMLKGLRLQDGSDLMAMAATDATLDAALADAATGYTISLWINVVSPSAWMSVLFNRITTTAGQHRISYSGASNTLYVICRGGTADVKAIGNMVAGWNHVVITLKGADSDANGLKVYLNVSTVQQYAVPAIPSGLTATTTRLGTVAPSAEVNDIIVWNRELSAAEVAALFEEQRVYYEVSAK